MGISPSCEWCFAALSCPAAGLYTGLPGVPLRCRYHQSSAAWHQDEGLTLHTHILDAKAQLPASSTESWNLLCMLPWGSRTHPQHCKVYVIV